MQMIEKDLLKPATGKIAKIPLSKFHEIPNRGQANILTIENNQTQKEDCDSKKIINPQKIPISV